MCLCVRQKGAGRNPVIDNKLKAVRTAECVFASPIACFFKSVYVVCKNLPLFCFVVKSCISEGDI